MADDAIPRPDRPSHCLADPMVLTKHHGLGNDFLIALEPGPVLGPEEAVRWCHRRTGLGADGLIVSRPLASGPDSPGPDSPGAESGEMMSWEMILYNADGSRAEISGNGVRCLGQAIARRLKLPPTEDHGLEISTDAGPRPLVIRAVGGEAVADPPPELWVTVGMGRAGDGPPLSDAWSAVGVEPTHQVGVDVGNPHLVAIVSSVEGFDMAEIGPMVEVGYPDGCNVHLVEVVDRSTLRLLVWERGAGVTQACGSGACAAAWAAGRLGLVDDAVKVRMPGGDASVDIADPDQVHLTGPATFVAQVTVDAAGGGDPR